MNTNVPLLLLDVDGVVNAVTGKPDKNVWSDWKNGTATADDKNWPIWWSPTVVETLSDLHTSGKVEVKWLTTWQNAAKTSLAPLLGFPDFEVVTVASDDSLDEVEASSTGVYHGAYHVGKAKEWWKFTAVKKLVEADPGRALVWVDDDLKWESKASEWVKANAGPSLLLAPQSHLGLTKKLLHNLAEFIKMLEEDKN